MSDHSLPPEQARDFDRAPPATDLPAPPRSTDGDGPRPVDPNPFAESAPGSGREGLNMAPLFDEAFAMTTSREGNWTILALSGELDMAQAELLDETIRQIEKEDCEQIILDLRELSFIDSTGLQVLFRVHDRCQRVSFIPSRHEEVKQLIALTGTGAVLGLSAEGQAAE